MFSGIVEGMGTVVAVQPTAAAENATGKAIRLRVDAGEIAHGVAHGDSIAVNGVCLTVVAISPTTAHNGDSATSRVSTAVVDFDVIGETVACTTIGGLAVGDAVNLERALKANARVDGHFVQGHVDGVAEIVSRDDTETETRMAVRVPAEVAAVCIRKGSIALDGVSLTIAEFDEVGRIITVALIPTTLARTTLGHRQVGQRLNVEGDLFGKYIVAYLSRFYGHQPAPTDLPPSNSAAAVPRGIESVHSPDKWRQLGF